jgi:ATP-dependent DNA ligase
MERAFAATTARIKSMRKHLLPLAPMEAQPVDEIPTGPEWQYEPKWDGFRCLALRSGQSIELQSKGEKPLGRYFPEIVEALLAIEAKQFLLDGELVVPVHGRFDFDQLLQRIHPAERRVRALASQYPAIYIVFDLLEDGSELLLDQPLRERRPHLESFAKQHFTKDGRIRLSPATTRIKQAQRWFRSAGGDLDGLIAKRVDLPYEPGERDAMVKVKPVHTADCVVGGFRYASHGKLVGSLLLGLYDDEGLLNHVGFTSAIKESERPQLTKQLEKLIEPPGFTGRAPGGPSRWSTKRSTEWQPLAPKLVVEVHYDHFSGDRFRHGTTFMRWRPDKSPRQCTFEQIPPSRGPQLRALTSNRSRARAG